MKRAALPLSASRSLASLLLASLSLAPLSLTGAAQTQAVVRPEPAMHAFDVVKGGINAPLTDAPGDAVRGRAIVVNKQLGLCLLCHAGPFPEERFQGTLAPDLTGAGSRWSAAQLRLRIADSARIDPDTVMPAYQRTSGLVRVGGAWQGRPVLTAQQVEDVVVFLQTLKAP